MNASAMVLFPAHHQHRVVVAATEQYQDVVKQSYAIVEGLWKGYATHQ